MVVQLHRGAQHRDENRDGYYQVTFPNLNVRPGIGAGIGGNAQVTTYGSSQVLCSVQGWETYIGTDAVVTVYCRNMATNTATDTAFSALLIF